MSATTIGKEGGTESRQFETHNFKVIDSKIGGDIDPKNVREVTKAAFFTSCDKTMAVLIFCKEEDIGYYKKKAKDTKRDPIVNQEDYR